jgi:hypothetical protein
MWARTVLLSIIVLAAVLGTGGLAAAADPAVTVSPSTGLLDGDQVAVQATGLPAGVTARLIECDQFVEVVEDVGNCPDITTAAADPSGQIAVTVTVQDLVLKDFQFGARFLPVYCRADVCRIFVVWTDVTGALHWVGSQPMEFVGSPATITAEPNTDLVDGQKVKVAGTAFGAEGRRLVVVQQACYFIIQDANCYGTSVSGTTTVGKHGTWRMKVRVHRFLADGTDCTEPRTNILGSCGLTAHVLDASGQVDESFGVIVYGDPSTDLTFQPVGS